MIHAVYDRRHYTLTVDGHAGSAPEGEDLVCAAATMLVRTLAANVEQLEVEGYAWNTICKMGKGYAEISCNPLPGFETLTRGIYDAICLGFEVLKANAEDFVDYSVEG